MMRAARETMCVPVPQQTWAAALVLYADGRKIREAAARDGEQNTGAAPAAASPRRGPSSLES